MIYPPDEEYSPRASQEVSHRPYRTKPGEYEDAVQQETSHETVDFRSESQYQSGPDTYLLQHRDVDFPLRIREYLRVGAKRSPSLANSLRQSHWGDSNVCL